MDEAQVDRLLTERVAAKRSREYDKADKLRDELRAMGIEVADKERTWRVRGSGGRGRGRGGDDRGTNGGGPDRGRKRERETDERGGSFANDGSFLDQFETESRHEDSVRQKKGGSSRDDEHDGRDDVGSKSGTTQFKKPSAALDPSKMLGMLQSLAGGASEEGGSGDQPAPAADTPSAGTTDAASEYSSEEDANKLAAEALRAKLMGDWRGTRSSWHAWPSSNPVAAAAAAVVAGLDLLQEEEQAGRRGRRRRRVKRATKRW